MRKLWVTLKELGSSLPPDAESRQRAALRRRCETLVTLYVSNYGSAAVANAVRRIAKKYPDHELAAALRSEVQGLPSHRLGQRDRAMADAIVADLSLLFSPAATEEE
jgi:hypothetical protein